VILRFDARPRVNRVALADVQTGTQLVFPSAQVTIDDEVKRIGPKTGSTLLWALNTRRIDNPLRTAAELFTYRFSSDVFQSLLRFA
jgi:hypothetical protein